jgi:hypothetical protein
MERVLLKILRVNITNPKLFEYLYAKSIGTDRAEDVSVCTEGYSVASKICRRSTEMSNIWENVPKDFAKP